MSNNVSQPESRVQGGKILGSGLICFVVVWSSCSTVSFIPKAGTAAKFNLATVEYVNTKAESQRDELIEQITADMKSILDSLLVEDRNRIRELETLMSQQKKTMASLSASLDTTNATVEQVSASLLRELSRLKSSTNSMQQYINQMSTSMESLPLEALGELQTALESYLTQKTEAKQE